jgi:hypothetical protein
VGAKGSHGWWKAFPSEQRHNEAVATSPRLTLRSARVKRKSQESVDYFSGHGSSYTPIGGIDSLAVVFGPTSRSRDAGPMGPTFPVLHIVHAVVHRLPIFRSPAVPTTP